MRRVAVQVQQVVQPVVEGLGYVYFGAEFGQAENGPTLRVYIDAEQGVDIDDCAVVSRQLSAVLDVEDVVAGAYALEVSSPGIDRPLFTAEQFERYAGEEVRVRLLPGRDSRRNYRGRLLGCDGRLATIEVDGDRHALALEDIESARIIGVLPTGGARDLHHG